MTLQDKRAQVLMQMQAPVGMDAAMGARVQFSVDEPAAAETAAPFFGGYMEDMLEDMGVVEQEDANVENFARA